MADTHSITSATPGVPQEPCPGTPFPVSEASGCGIRLWPSRLRLCIPREFWVWVVLFWAGVPSWALWDVQEIPQILPIRCQQWPCRDHHNPLQLLQWPQRARSDQWRTPGHLVDKRCPQLLLPWAVLSGRAGGGSMVAVGQGDGLCRPHTLLSAQATASREDGASWSRGHGSGGL